ncbi:MAG: hypothetical protein WCJ39_06970 [bacterium]
MLEYKDYWRHKLHEAYQISSNDSSVLESKKERYKRIFKEANCYCMKKEIEKAKEIAQ